MTTVQGKPVNYDDHEEVLPHVEERDLPSSNGETAPI